VAGMSPMDFLSSRAPAITAAHLGVEAGFISISDIPAAARSNDAG
jgi:hypothetical protein